MVHPEYVRGVDLLISVRIDFLKSEWRSLKCCLNFKPNSCAVLRDLEYLSLHFSNGVSFRHPATKLHVSLLSTSTFFACPDLGHIWHVYLPFEKQSALAVVQSIEGLAFYLLFKTFFNTLFLAAT